MKTEKRIPRPIGTTEIAKALHKQKTNKEEIKEQLQNHIINHYIHTGYTYCHNPLSLEEFSQYTKIHQRHITKTMMKDSDQVLKLLGEDAQGELLRVISSLALNWSLEDRIRALQQVSILKSSQGNSYKPFISSEVTKALKLALDSTAQMQNLIKALTSQGPNVIINNSAQATAQTLTITEALSLIEKETQGKAQLLQDEEAKKALMMKHNILDMPEVDARKQQGIDTKKEGLEINKLAKLSDKFIRPNKEHIDRRAQELEIDIDADEV